MNFTVEQQSPSVTLVRMEVSAGWRQRFLIRSDAHHDNQHCDQVQERKHLEQAKACGAGIFDFGDLFCAMQGKWDRRADQDQLREELRGNDYLNRLVEYAAPFYEPYKDNFVLLTPGNHETGVVKRHGYNLTQALCDRLGCRMGTYASWIGFRFTINKTKRQTLWMYAHHGYGGGGPVTRGVIQTNRMAVYLPDATLVYTGHTHDEWIVTIQRQRISNQGIPYLDEQVHMRAPGYKDEFSPAAGWHVERGGPPKPRGALWLEFYVDGESLAEGRVKYDVTRAK